MTIEFFFLFPKNIEKKIYRQKKNQDPFKNRNKKMSTTRKRPRPPLFTFTYDREGHITYECHEEIYKYINKYGEIYSDTEHARQHIYGGGCAVCDERFIQARLKIDSERFERPKMMERTRLITDLPKKPKSQKKKIKKPKSQRKYPSAQESQQSLNNNLLKKRSFSAGR